MEQKYSVYQEIYKIVRRIPSGKVATYGQIASIVGRCTPRMVGYALAALSFGSDVPWHRVINARGKISTRSDGETDSLQQQLLLAEGVIFDSTDSIDLNIYRWTK